MIGARKGQDCDPQSFHCEVGYVCERRRPIAGGGQIARPIRPGRGQRRPFNRARAQNFQRTTGNRRPSGQRPGAGANTINRRGRRPSPVRGKRQAEYYDYEVIISVKSS